ncbi:tyrosine-type recombinase/integrase [Marinobacterium iners]|uniref:Site-specific recombinase XerD n=1 Tax=Marinobacterium iners DSM 11526 TaxID=1122198 RepID=A0A1H4H3R0_9GAMM|nr:tyrosine-type recombinase/integrase [Marinobacterium iners]SEB16449.1 Site-specific recombinase XerD [Marinobacterium iners DSM 11526]
MSFFRGCVVFPFLDADGSITGAYGKRITPKLKAGSVYQVYWITERTRLFNERVLLDAKEIILCKNPLEALIWWQQGFQRVIALMSCHAFKQIHLDLLREHRIERVYLALCGTAAELDAMRTIAVMMEAANMVLFPDGQDDSHFVNHRTPSGRLCRVARTGDQGVTTITSIDLELLEAYRRYLYRYRKPRDHTPLDLSTQRMRLMEVTGFLKCMRYYDIIQSNFFSKFPLPRVPRKLPPVIPAEQVITIRKGKGSLDRKVPIAPRALDWLQRYIEDLRPEQLTLESGIAVFLGRAGRRIQRSALTDLVGEYVRRSGVGKEGACYLMRHASATHMLKHGADIRYVQELLGHQDIKSTQIYTHVTISDLNAVYRRTHPAAKKSTKS